MVSKRVAQQAGATATTDAETAYPSPRYFQIHFQHLHHTIEHLHQQLQEVNRQLAELRQFQQSGSPDLAHTSPRQDVPSPDLARPGLRQDGPAPDLACPGLRQIKAPTRPKRKSFDIASNTD